MWLIAASALCGYTSLFVSSDNAVTGINDNRFCLIKFVDERGKENVTVSTRNTYKAVYRPVEQ